MRDGTVEYHNGTQCTGFPLRYRLSDDWIIERSIEEYRGRCKDQLRKRAATIRLDTRAVLYGEPLLEFVVHNALLLNVSTTSTDESLSQSATKDPLFKVEQIAGQEGRFTPAEDALRVKQQKTHHSDSPHALACRDTLDPQVLSDNDEPRRNLLSDAVVDIHRRWLMTPRDDLNGESPREILFAKQDLIDSDLESRSNQWSYFLEEPPSLSRDSSAYRFAGFGTHELVMYYDLVRFLIWEAVELVSSTRFLKESFSTSGDNLSFTPSFSLGHSDTNEPETVSKVSNEESVEPRCELSDHLSFTPSFSLGHSDSTQAETVSTVSYEQSLMSLLDQLKNIWLSEPREDYIPAEVIDNERRRRPEAMTGRSMVVDEDCPLCKLSGDLSESGLEITFSHFDGCHVEEEFAFSSCATPEEWEGEQSKLEQWDRER